MSLVNSSGFELLPLFLPSKLVQSEPDGTFNKLCYGKQRLNRKAEDGCGKGKLKWLGHSPHVIDFRGERAERVIGLERQMR